MTSSIGSSVSYTIHVTHMNGDAGIFTGSRLLIERIEDALYAAGARFERRSESWDFGFYAGNGDYDDKRGAPLNGG